MLAPTPRRPTSCSGGPWAQPGVTYQRPAGTLRRHVTGNGAWETLREEEGEGFRADSPRPAPHMPSRAHSGRRGSWESRLLGAGGRRLPAPAAQRHRGWGPRQTWCACVLLPPNSALAGAVAGTQPLRARQGLRLAAVAPAMSRSSWVCSRLRVQVRTELRASLCGEPSAGPCLGLVRGVSGP